MKILAREPSREPCEEAGWRAYDYRLDAPMTPPDILRLKTLGSLAYLTQLRQPFFKVQNHYYTLKGLENQPLVRVGIHREHEAELAGIEAVLEGGAPNPDG